MNPITRHLPRGAAALAVVASLSGGVLVATPAHGAPSGTIAIPRQAALKAKDFPIRMTLDFDSGQSVTHPAAGGQYCDTTDNRATGREARPIGGRQWDWLEAGSGEAMVAVTHIVTVWDDGAGALADLRNDTGYCRMAGYDGAPKVTITESTDTSFEATIGAEAIASRLVGNTLVSVTVGAWREVDFDQTVEADRLADLAAAKVARFKRN